MKIPKYHFVLLNSRSIRTRKKMSLNAALSCAVLIAVTVGFAGLARISWLASTYGLSKFAFSAERPGQCAAYFEAGRSRSGSFEW